MDTDSDYKVKVPTSKSKGKIKKKYNKKGSPNKKFKTGKNKSIKDKSISKEPEAFVEKQKLRRLLNSLKEEPKIKSNKSDLQKCIAHMHPTVKPIWTCPSVILKAISDALLTRNWNCLTYLLLELVHHTGEVYKPVIRNVCTIMDKLHPVIRENDLQGSFKNIKKYHQKILDDTKIV